MIQAIWYYQSTLTVCAKMREGKGAIDAVPALIPLLQDKVAHVRVSAAMALGQIGSEDAVPALIQALKDRDEYVRDYVTGALGEIGTPEALKAVEEYQSP
ncbi:MAG: HEAT repeat domain-containing protein [Candidatus Poribacteria bacterium]|jgi:HEAT repeat protein